MRQYFGFVVFLVIKNILSFAVTNQLPLGGESDPLRIKQESPDPRILASIRGTESARPEIRILDSTTSKVFWEWDSKHDLTSSEVPASLLPCITSNAAATDAKQSLGGNRIAAIYGDAIIVVQYSPEDPSTDKKLLWGVCADSGLLVHSHTLEFLPDGLLAIATSGQSEDDGFLVFNTSVAKVPDNPKPVQAIQGYHNIHALVWEPETQTLWAAGANSSIDDPETSSGLIRGYRYQPRDERHLPLNIKPVFELSMPAPTRIYTEWYGKCTYEVEWDSPHDLILVPGQDVFLVPTDTDLYALNRSSKEFSVGKGVADEYLRAFQPVDKRRGVNWRGHAEELPRSDLKSIAFQQGGAAIYVQAAWRDFFATSINIWDEQGGWRSVPSGGEIYHARWWQSK